MIKLRKYNYFQFNFLTINRGLQLPNKIYYLLLCVTIDALEFKFINTL